MPDPSNIFANVPTALPDELVEVLAATDAVRIERIVSMGHASPEGFWYDQETDEWVLLLRGAARLRFERDEQPVAMKPGDFLQIPAHRRHRVEWTDPQQPTIWLAVHCRIPGN
jgi:cupin 2 domain-containing protein